MNFQEKNLADNDHAVEMEIIKIHQHQDSESSTIPLKDDTMDHYTHERTSHHTSFFSRFWSSSSLSPRFLGLCFLVFIYYIGYGYLQELMFTLQGFENTAWFLTCYQFFVYAILSFIHLGFAGLDQRRASYRSYLLLALLTVTTMGLSNYAVAYLNYPTQVMFKCCKLIPVLIGGILIQRKTFNRYDVAAAFCMSTGLIFFTLADSKVRPNFNLYGVIIICSALVADAAIGNYQEKIMKEHHVPNVEIVFYSFIFGFAFVLFGLLVTNNFFPSLDFWNKHPLPTYGYGLLFSIFGYLGIDIVLTLIKEYGALICVTVTTCRKAITIILSFTLFSKPFVFDYVWSGLIVIVGIYLNVYSRNQTAFNAKITSMANSVFHSRLWPNENELEKEQNFMMTSLHPSSSIYLFGKDLSDYNRKVQFLLTATAVLVFHVAQGYIQELILQLKSLRAYPNYFTLVYFVFFTILAYVERFFFERAIKRRKAPIQTYAIIAFFTIATMGLSNAAVMRLNYPTHMMFKSCKLIPVMIGSMLILGKRYTLYDILACLCMTVGLIFFTLADSQVQPEFDLLGVWLVCCALVADAVIGNVQEKALKEYKPSNSEMILFSYSIGAVYLLIFDSIFGSSKEAFWIWWAHPIKSYVFTMFYSFAGYLGVNCVLNLVRHFGALIAVTVTTFRKTITIILSFIAFTKPFTLQYLWSGSIVAFGIYLNAYGQNQKAIESYTRSICDRLMMKFRKTNDRYRYPSEIV